MRVALKYGELPHAPYVLGRLADVDTLADLEVEHIFPLAPGDGWSGDGEREWADYTDDEQNSHRALAQTLGNLALLEEPLAERVADRLVRREARAVYAKSGIAITRELADDAAWGTAAIAARTVAAHRRRSCRSGRIPRPSESTTTASPRSSTRSAGAAGRAAGSASSSTSSTAASTGRSTTSSTSSTASSSGCGRTRASMSSRSARAAAARSMPAQAWNGQWDALDESNFLYMGWDSKYMLTAVQGVLEEAGLAAEVFVKYSYIGAAM